MKKSVAMKWIKALRSGKYKQGTETLQSGDRYCCLGVLCDIAPVIKNTKGGAPSELDGQTLLMQSSVQNWSGIEHSIGHFPNLHLNLAALNDGFEDYDGEVRQLTFDEIADIIQICWEEL